MDMKAFKESVKTCGISGMSLKRDKTYNFIGSDGNLKTGKFIKLSAQWEGERLFSFHFIMADGRSYSIMADYYGDQHHQFIEI